MPQIFIQVMGILQFLVRGPQWVLVAGDASVNSVCNAFAGDSDFINDSPIRNAWKPAPCSLAMSAPVWMPLSATLMTFFGMRLANSNAVLRSTLNVCRLRLFTPIRLHHALR